MRYRRLLALALPCLLSLGCVQGETVITVNPDGSARLKVEVISGVRVNTYGPAGTKKPDEESIEDVLRRTIKPTLEMPGVAAWKDVSAEFLPDGKLKFRGTAYVKQLEDLKSPDITFFFPRCSITREANGQMTLATLNKGSKDPSKRTPKSAEEIQKMSDAELDKHILYDLIQMQGERPMLLAVLSDAKMKTTYILPGEVTSAVGLAKDKNTATLAIDGNKILAGFNKYLTMDPASLRKAYREAPNAKRLPESLFMESFADSDSLSLTVAKPGEALFDFNQEVAAAREAYPQLRKKFGFGDELRLPGAQVPPKK